MTFLSSFLERRHTIRAELLWFFKRFRDWFASHHFASYFFMASQTLCMFIFIMYEEIRWKYLQVLIPHVHAASPGLERSAFGRRSGQTPPEPIWWKNYKYYELYNILPIKTL
jgi:hypothetical protein